ncbi:hypothetical protein PICMEDRAFT_73203 [Pichia membranifaciens NRRL Y-2026]|uniref:GPI inositol-deacylase n=1 Tax=Pichia membranifaciens NRRL Y-2026 TaxID=763406 RepID=A0A1E3NHT1_9ASCO|nr:hypothetical protein PICMEDRAFT_73203 [Pichia membranifaciens NRRL Y-2026]ODQ45689.1 hypothetical protein PICMEDRAFT_73203 [Pichia membranifaciens NRRL Y-2026]
MGSGSGSGSARVSPPKPAAHLGSHGLDAADAPAKALKSSLNKSVSRASTGGRSSIRQISYSGEVDDDDDDVSIESYQPDDSKGYPEAPNDPTNKFSRQISREDASSIIGGINLASPNLSAKSSRVVSSIPSGRIQPTVVHRNSLQGTPKVSRTIPKIISQNEDGLESYAQDNDESHKVFNFSLPFSNPTNAAVAEDIENEDEAVADERQQENVGKKPSHARPKHHDDFSLITKTFRKLSHVLPFSAKSKSHSKARPVLQRRSSHPEAPDPPADVYVYWNDISHKVMPDEMLDREDVRLKLERQESLDTLQEARYYKDITHLDDGKFKALRQSLLPHAPSLSLSQSISSKISFVTTRIRSDSLTPTPTQSQALPIPDPAPKLAVTEAKDIALTPPNNVPSSAVVQNNNKSLTSLNNSINSTLIEKEPSATPSASTTTANNSHNPLLSTLATTTKFVTSVPMSPISSITHQTDASSSMQIYDDLDGDVIVLGGYRGSILRDSRTHRRTWIPVLKAGLNIRKINLMIGPSDDDELRELNARDVVFNRTPNISPDDKDYPDSYPDGMLTHIGPVDISRRLLKRLNSNPNVTARDWGYDWRLSPELLCEQLHSELISIVNKQKNKKGVILIAHSMGGIIAHGAMVKDPSLVRAIIYAGTPMPCANILGPFRFNDSILLSRDILTHEANFFMRSSYVFIPPSWGGEDENGEGGGMCLFRDLRSGKRYMIDFWDEKNWVLYNLSPLVSNVRLKQDIASGKLDLHSIKDTALKHEIKKFLKIKVNHDTESIVLDEISKLHEPVVLWLDCYMYLARTLGRTKTFIKSLERKDHVNYPPMAQIFSNGVPSVKYSLVDGEECIKRGEYYKFFYGPGDGVVYQGWNFPRERGRKRPNGPDRCGKGSVDPVANVPDWRGREYGYGEKYAYDLCGRFRSTAGHIGLLVDHDLVGQALNAVMEEEKKRILES